MQVNVSLSAYLKSSKMDLYQYYKAHYSCKHLTPSQVTNPVPSPSADPVPPHSPQNKITLCFQRKAKVAINKLDELLKPAQEDFKTCNPIYWWMGHHAQFPNLFWLAWDILCIPGCILCSSLSSWD